jgi:predicted lysophospholipase L1 biosynthesis ABC-type transport system permease subunit
VLKTLGFLRRQVAATVAWQATATALTALVVGLPLGLVVGRWAWAAMAAQVQASAGPAVPLLLVGAAVPFTLVVANALAAGPGWLAARIRPAAVLRSE